MNAVLGGLAGGIADSIGEAWLAQIIGVIFAGIDLRLLGIAQRLVVSVRATSGG